MSKLSIYKKFICSYSTGKGGEIKWKASFPDGQGHQCRKRGFINQDAALEWVSREHDRTRLGYIRTKQSFCDFSRDYLFNEKEVKPSTRISYEETLRLYICPYFKNISIADLNVQSASGFLKSLHANKKISGTYKRKIFSIFKQSYRAALTCGYALDYRVMNLPLPKKDTPEAKYWTTEEMQCFINSYELRSDERFYLWVLASMIGGRAGEFMALEWGDLDLDSDHPTIAFNKRRCQKSGEVFLGTKNGDSRIIDMHPDAVCMFKELREKKLPAFPLKKVFDQSLDQKHFARDLKTACRKIGVSEITFHQLRHSFLTWLGSQGMNGRLISMIAGHRDERITDQYVHRNRGIQKQLWSQEKPKLSSLLNKPTQTVQYSDNIADDDSDSGVILK